ncbi:MAG: hypothetical protein R6W91_03145 [Thermoplasmata archaeon]
MSGQNYQQPPPQAQQPYPQQGQYYPQEKKGLESFFIAKDKLGLFLIEHVIAHIPRFLNLRIRAIPSNSNAMTYSIKGSPSNSIISAIKNQPE